MILKHLVENWRKFLDEIIDPNEIDLSSFAVKSELCPKIWIGNRIRPEIKEKLLEIANDFLESLNLPDLDLLDITLTGSLANYTWSEFSDIDLHLIVRFRDITEDIILARKWLTEARARWNQQHDIKIKEHEVEIYVQDVDEEHHSTGIYSILNDSWIEVPNPEKPTMKWEEVKSKTASLMDEIDVVEDMFNSKNLDGALEYADRLKEKLKDFRKSGLETGGQFSSENIAFKTLRRNGYLEKLSKIRNDAYDQSKSINENRQWERFTNEAAMTPERIPQGWKVVIDETKANTLSIFLKNERSEIVGKMIVSHDPRLPCIDALSVKVAQAPRGFGPFLYDISMELAGERGIYSDRVAVSSAAERVWKFYDQQRSDVGSFHPLDNMGYEDDECRDDVEFLFGPDWDSEATNKIYFKKSEHTKTLDSLKAANLIELV